MENILFFQSQAERANTAIKRWGYEELKVCLQRWQSINSTCIILIFSFASSVYRAPWAGSRVRKGQCIHICKNVSGQGRAFSWAPLRTAGVSRPRNSDI